MWNLPARLTNKTTTLRITSVKLRIKAFHENTEPLLAFLDERELTRIVDAEPEPTKVYRALRQNFLPKIAFVLGDKDGAAVEEKRAAVAAASGCEWIYALLVPDELLDCCN